MFHQDTHYPILKIMWPLLYVSNCPNFSPLWQNIFYFIGWLETSQTTNPFGFYPYSFIAIPGRVPYYFVTVHPKIYNGTFYPTSPLHTTSWLGWASFISIFIMLTVTTFGDGGDIWEIVFTYGIGQFGTLTKWPNPFMRQTSRRRMFHVLWTVAIFYMIQFYNLTLRAKLISQNELYVPESPQELDLSTQLAFLQPPPGISKMGTLAIVSFSKLLLTKHYKPEYFGNDIVKEITLAKNQQTDSYLKLDPFFVALAKGKISGNPNIIRTVRTVLLVKQASSRLTLCFMNKHIVSPPHAYYYAMFVLLLI